MFRCQITFVNLVLSLYAAIIFGLVLLLRDEQKSKINILFKLTKISFCQEKKMSEKFVSLNF